MGAGQAEVQRSVAYQTVIGLTKNYLSFWHKYMVYEQAFKEVSMANGINVGRLRAALGEDQRTFGSRFGVHGGTISNWETGRCAPTRSNLEKLKKLRSQLRAKKKDQESASRKKPGNGVPRFQKELEEFYNAQNADFIERLVTHAAGVYNLDEEALFEAFTMCVIACEGENLTLANVKQILTADEQE